MRTLTTLTAALFLASPLPAADVPRELLDNWHQWRGPLGTGMAPTGDPPLRWDEKTNIKWKVPLPGRGSSTPAVWGDRVFVLTAEDTGRPAARGDIPAIDPRYRKLTKPPRTYHRWLVLCLDRKTGRTLWQHTAREAVPHEGHHRSHSYGAYSPVTDGQRLYAWFGSRGLYCYDLEGKQLWQRHFGRLETRLGWGEGGSPAVHKGTLVVTFDHEGKDFLIALDAASGRTRWKVGRDEPTTWATPLVVEHNGTTQVIVNGTNRARSYDLATGRVLWECGGQTVNAVPSPVAAAGVAYCMSGYRGSFACAIPLDARGDITGTRKVLWKHTRGTPYVPSPLLAGGRLYFTHVNQPVLTCLDAKTGRPLIDRRRLPGLGEIYASPAGAKDRIYIVDRDGATLVIRRADRLEVLATNRLDDPIDASPAIAGRQLFLRGHRHLYCIEESNQRSAVRRQRSEE